MQKAYKDKAKAQEVITNELRETILKYLKERHGMWVNYWNLHDVLVKMLEIPKEFQGFFREDFEAVIYLLDREKLVCKSWNPGMGGILMYPYETALCSMIESDIALKAMHEMVKINRDS
jgi:hypothetical protein